MNTDCINEENVSGWRAVLDYVRAKRPALASVLEHAALLRFGPDRVELGYEARSFLVGQATEASSKELLLSACRTYFGAATEVSIETIDSREGAVTIAVLDSEARKSAPRIPPPSPRIVWAQGSQGHSGCGGDDASRIVVRPHPHDPDSMRLMVEVCRGYDAMGGEIWLAPTPELEVVLLRRAVLSLAERVKE